MRPRSAPRTPSIQAVNHLDRRRVILLLAVAVPALAAATLGVAVMEAYVGVPDASAVYLVAVVVTAFATGTVGAVISAVVAFLLYDFLFVEPLHTFTVADPVDWLNLFLLLFVGIVVGQLTALQRSRAEDARAREREARALFRVSRSLATRDSMRVVLATIATTLRDETRMERVWVALGGDDARERVVADTAADARALIPPVHQVLRRMPGDEPARWLRVHRPSQPRAPRAEIGPEAFRVRVEDGGEALGSIWALRERRDGEPDGTETRLLAASADQIGQALAHDRLEAEAQAAAIARESDALKSALLQSVSHDLRTPLATIRAAAGTLRPGSPLSDADRAESADAIDREVEYLDRLVTNLLDLSRIEAGVLRAERDVFDLEDLVGRTIDRLRRRIAGRSLEVSLAAPPVEVDPVFVDEAVTNILENAVKYTPPDARIRVVADLIGDGPFVRLTIEDAGPGVPEETLPRLFDKFYRVPGSPRGSRSGTGIGLAVARGLVEATGGAVAARRSDLGGLAIDVDLPVAAVPAELGGTGGA
jgi:two-component system sensor histidine kinase KdpD